MKYLAYAFVCIIVLTSSVFAADMREIAVKAKDELQDSLKKQHQKRLEIKNDRERLQAQVSLLQQETSRLRGSIQSYEQQIDVLQKKNMELEEAVSQEQSELDELSGAVRVSAGNLKSVLVSSLYTAIDPDRVGAVDPILDNTRFPGIDDMDRIADLFLEEADLTSQIQLGEHKYVSGSGTQITGKVLILGGFTAAYSQKEGTGFLTYSPETFSFTALSALPSRPVRSTLKKYIKGDSDEVYVDMSRGEALRQITHHKSLKEQIMQGGPLVWPILGLGVFAIFIALERSLFLNRVRSNADKVMGKVNELAARGQWDECHAIVGEKNIPVYNVLRAGLKARNHGREVLESILQEAILKEMPRIERFLPILNIMGAIAPLLGLLGTVTGMISTFHVITIYGTGDPRMMSGGISTALVTTMLGLSVAIPIMLIYTFLCRKVDKVIGEMEEKAVALTNIIFREGC